MKKLMVISSVLMVFVMLFLGCSAIQINPDTQAVTIKAAARIAGYQFAVKNPALVGPALAYAKPLAELSAGTFTDSQKLVNELWPAAVKNLLDNISDPVLRVALSDAASMVQINVPNVSIGTQAAQVKAALDGFIEGVEMGRK